MIYLNCKYVTWSCCRLPYEIHTLTLCPPQVLYYLQIQQVWCPYLKSFSIIGGKVWDQFSDKNIYKYTVSFTNTPWFANRQNVICKYSMICTACFTNTKHTSQMNTMCFANAIHVLQIQNTTRTQIKDRFHKWKQRMEINKPHFSV